MIRQIRMNLSAFVPMIGIFVLAMAVSAYILHHVRVRFPFFDKQPFTLKAELTDAKAVAPGQGQTVRVSGVRIGDISGVKLEDGHAVATMQIDDRFKHLVHTDATILVRPRTGLDDMFFELDPGSNSAPVAKENYTIPVRNTLPFVNADEVLSSLDADTRSYLDLIVNGAGQGLRGRGNDLREIFRRFGPTHRDLATFSTAVAQRRRNLARLIHSLNVLNGEVAQRGPELTRLIGSSAAVFRAFASEDANVSRTVRDLPGALAQTTSTLAKVRTYAGVLGPAAQRLRAPLRELDTANRAVQPFAREAAPILRTQIRPFVRGSRPLVRDLRPAAGDLATATPDLSRTFAVLNTLLNMVGYNPGGRQGPEVANREEGMLFWIAWLDHQSVNLFYSADAHGNLRPAALLADCDTFRNLVASQPQLEFLLNLTPILTSQQACGAVQGFKLPSLPSLAQLKKEARR